MLEKQEQEGWISGTNRSMHTILFGMFAVIENGLVFILTGCFVLLTTSGLERLGPKRTHSTDSRDYIAPSYHKYRYYWACGAWYVSSLPPPIRTRVQHYSTCNIRESIADGNIYSGKSTVVKAITGVQTVRFKNELERNITIKLGYANAKLYQVCPKMLSANNNPRFHLY